MSNELRRWMRLVEDDDEDDVLDPREEAKIDIWTMLTRRFGKLETGQSRAAFRDGRYVIKYPLNSRGERDNIREAKLWREKTLPHPVARCRLFSLRDIPLLVMEYLEPIAFKDTPEWAAQVDKGVTGENLGRRTSGEIAAYDYAGRD